MKKITSIFAYSSSHVVTTTIKKHLLCRLLAQMSHLNLLEEPVQ